ncbi:MAG: respiratory nitrate reductase subunit gamma [Coriobacteriia bacterium]|nr:respiratory nitrate reductase subunit gamma [Coriobacteriia bacterium]
METYLWITSVWGVYLGIAVFVLGMGWRIYQWASTPKSPVRLGMFPKPAGKGGRFLKMLKDTFIAPHSARIEPKMYFFAMMFHIAALGAFVGHLRIFGEYPILPELLDKVGIEMDAFAAWAGSIAGTLMLVGVIYWIFRRTYGPYKNLSVPEDYLLLFLLFGVIIMGDHLRFVYGGYIHADTYQEWFKSLLVFKPFFPDKLLSGFAGWSLGTHMLFTDLFLIYFPFSKLVHTIGSFAANYVRSE